jgi:spermidine synthase
MERDVKRQSLWFANIFVVATCGLVYELLAGTVASYLLGDSVTQFSFVIGLYLSAMGAGAWLAQYMEKGVAEKFVRVELAVAVLGGLSAPAFFMLFPYIRHFSLVLYGAVFAIGTLVGLELPLFLRLLKDRLEFKDLVSRVLAFDYLGALAASLLFPLLLVPALGVVRTSLIVGLANAAVALWSTWLLAPDLPRSARRLRLEGAVVCLLLLAGLLGAGRLTHALEEWELGGRVVYAESTPYQRIVVARNGEGFQLYLNRHLQFDSRDEYRYHEALVHPAMQAAGGRPERVAILGGGDGLALREVLGYASVRSVVLVDLDPGMTNLSRNYPPLAELNRRAYDDPRIQVLNRDAMLWVAECRDTFDVVIADFPDPSTYALSKLFTRRFYTLLRNRLSPDGAVAVQCTSPLHARRSYWCIIRTMEAAGLAVRPYQAAVPSFGVWGFALARAEAFEAPLEAPAGLRFLDDSTMRGLFVFGPDTGPVDAEVNRLDDQVLVRYYEEEWGRLQ